MMRKRRIRTREIVANGRENGQIRILAQRMPHRGYLYAGLRPHLPARVRMEPTTHLHWHDRRSVGSSQFETSFARLYWPETRKLYQF
jgi:hypothetical protein